MPTGYRCDARYIINDNITAGSSYSSTPYSSSYGRTPDEYPSQPSLSDSKHECVDGPPSPKRPKYANPSSPLSEDGDKEKEEDKFDPDSFFMSSSPTKLAEPVQKFMQSALKHCIPKRKRRQLGAEYPCSDLPAAKVPKLDPDIVGALADDFKGGEDRQLMKIQASVLASSSPLANFWSHLTEQGFEGKEDEYMAAGEVLDMIKASLILIGHIISHSPGESRLLTRPKNPGLDWPSFCRIFVSIN